MSITVLVRAPGGKKAVRSSKCGEVLRIPLLEAEKLAEIDLTRHRRAVEHFLDASGTRQKVEWQQQEDEK